jgi:hydrogenase small subunit
MAVTRREFVTTLGMLGLAAGMSQSNLASITEAFAHGGAWAAGNSWTSKPKVIWVHGAECTGCSTSLLSLYEDAAGVAIPGATSATDTSTAAALSLITGSSASTALGKLTDTLGGTHPYGHRTLETTGLNVDGNAYAVNIADVLIDFIDLQYHETVMGMGGDQAYEYLKAAKIANDTVPFVLVVEGAVQDKSNKGYWDKSGAASWCSIAMDGTPNATPAELSFDDVVADLAARADCKAVVAIGQCATYGGYPACIGPDLVAHSGVVTKSQTGAQGVADFLTSRGLVSGASDAVKGASAKVINVPGCPANPWWFTLTVVAWLVDAVAVTGGATLGPLKILKTGLAINGDAVDTQGRLKAVYGDLLHGKYCPRYKYYTARVFATKPGEMGCMKNIGCKGLSTMSSCGRHGWNNAQPQNKALNASTLDTSTTTSAQLAPLYTIADGGTEKMGGCCLTAGAPCMGCTEKGYPDAFTPFVVR